MDLVKEIKKKQKELLALAEKKNNCLSDPEIYERSCAIDQLIVQLMKQKKSQNLNK